MTEFTTVEEFIETLSDEDCIELFVNLLKERVAIGTAYLRDDEGLLTHSMIVIECGEFDSVTPPEPLPNPFILAPTTVLVE